MISNYILNHSTVFHFNIVYDILAPSPVLQFHFWSHSIINSNGIEGLIQFH